MAISLLLVTAAAASAQDGTPSQAANASPAAPVRLGQAPDEAPAVEPTVIPFELLINRPMVRVTINGQGPFGLLLGPEEQQSRIDPELAELLKLRPPEAGQPMLTIDVAFTDDGSRHRLRLANGVLTHRRAGRDDGADLTITLPHHAQLVGVVAGQVGPEAMAEAGIEMSGDPAVVQRLAAVLQPGDPDFAIVTAEKE